MRRTRHFRRRVRRQNIDFVRRNHRNEIRQQVGAEVQKANSPAAEIPPPMITASGANSRNDVADADGEKTARFVPNFDCRFVLSPHRFDDGFRRNFADVATISLIKLGSPFANFSWRGGRCERPRKSFPDSRLIRNCSEFRRAGQSYVRVRPRPPRHRAEFRRSK